MNGATDDPIIDWLFVGVDPELVASAGTPRTRAITVDHWPDAVRVMVAARHVRVVVLGPEVADIGAASQRVWAMHPGAVIHMAGGSAATWPTSVSRWPPGTESGR